MLKSENISETRVKHYSDSGYKIRQKETGKLYDEAVDVIPCKYTYEETETESELIVDYEQLLNIVSGGGSE